MIKLQTVSYWFTGGCAKIWLVIVIRCKLRAQPGCILCMKVPQCDDTKPTLDLLAAWKHSWDIVRGEPARSHFCYLLSPVFADLPQVIPQVILASFTIHRLCGLYWEYDEQVAGVSHCTAQTSVGVSSSKGASSFILRSWRYRLILLTDLRGFTYGWLTSFSDTWSICWGITWHKPPPCVVVYPQRAKRCNRGWQLSHLNQ